MIYLGYAQCDITPEDNMPLIGFYRKEEKSKGCLKPLLAQISVWKDGKNKKSVLVTIDSLGFSKKQTDDLRVIVAEYIGTEKECVMICFSHTHAAPDSSNSKYEYYDLVCKKINDAVKVAVSNMKAVNIGWENVEADIGVNRRNTAADIDKRVGILKVCESDSKEIKLLILRATAHGNSLKRDNLLISPDWFGAVREIVGERYNCPVMMVQGAAGNVAPKYFCSKETPVDASGEKYVRSNNALKDMAEVVLTALVPKVDNINTSNLDVMDVYSKEITLTAPVPSIEDAEKIAYEANRFCGIDGTSWLKEIKDLHFNNITAQYETVEVQFFMVGNWCLCGVPYEIMNEFAIRAAKDMNNPYFYFNGYTNGCLTYFPTEKEYDKGGYEVFWSLLIYYIYFDRVSAFEREACTKLIDFVVEVGNRTGV